MHKCVRIMTLGVDGIKAMCALQGVTNELAEGDLEEIEGDIPVSKATIMAIDSGSSLASTGTALVVPTASAAKGSVKPAQVGQRNYYSSMSAARSLMVWNA